MAGRVRQQSMRTTHKWQFKSRFRAGAYGWKGTRLASQRLREAVSEIEKVAKSDPVEAADGVVAMVERIWPALEHVDSSSGALGTAVNRTLGALLPILISAPADRRTRSKWMDRLYDAVCGDGVGYLAHVQDRWGEICGFRELAAEWADRFRPVV